MPKVTVLMSVYNEEKFLRETIESILKQNFSDFEFLIINDASTDLCREIILSYDDPRIILVDNDTNMGLTKSLNKGLQLARGEYIARMDADDVAFPWSLEKRVYFLETRSDFVLVSGKYEAIDEYGNTLYVKINYSEDEIIREGLLGANIIASHTLYRKDAASKIGFYDICYQYAQDYDFSLRMSEIGKVYNVDEVLYKCRVHKNSISSRKGEERKKIDRSIRQAALQRISEEQRARAPLLLKRGLKDKYGCRRLSYVFNDFGCHYIKHKFLQMAKREFLISLKTCPFNPKTYYYLFFLLPFRKARYVCEKWLIGIKS